MAFFCLFVFKKHYIGSILTYSIRGVWLQYPTVKGVLDIVMFLVAWSYWNREHRPIRQSRLGYSVQVSSVFFFHTWRLFCLTVCGIGQAPAAQASGEPTEVKQEPALEPKKPEEPKAEETVKDTEEKPSEEPQAGDKVSEEPKAEEKPSETLEAKEKESEESKAEERPSEEPNAKDKASEESKAEEKASLEPDAKDKTSEESKDEDKSSEGGEKPSEPEGETKEEKPEETTEL